MIDNKERIGNFTNSEIWKLCASLKNGQPSEAYYTYIKKKMYERALGRSVDMGKKTQSMTWGSFLEKYVHFNLPNEYQLMNKKSIVHPKYPFWCGAVDFIVPGVKVSELKCFEPENFASYTLALMTRDTEKIKAEHPKEYWQIIGNSVINDTPMGEGITFMPYESEMDGLRDLMQDEKYLESMGLELRDLYWIHEKPNSELAVLPDDSKLKNLNIYEFEIPMSDKLFITKRVLDANKLLIKV